MLPTSTRSVQDATTGRDETRPPDDREGRAPARRPRARPGRSEPPDLAGGPHEQRGQADAARGEQEVEGGDRHGDAEQHDGALRHRAQAVGALGAVRGVAEHRQAQPERAEDAAGGDAVVQQHAALARRRPPRPATTSRDDRRQARGGDVRPSSRGHGAQRRGRG